MPLQVSPRYVFSVLLTFRSFVGNFVESLAEVRLVVRRLGGLKARNVIAWAEASLRAKAQAITYRAVSPPEIANSIVVSKAIW